MEFCERTRDCSLGKQKTGLISLDGVISCFFLIELWHNVWGFSELQRGTQVASRVAPGKSSLHSICEGVQGIALQARQGNRASRRIERGIARSFLRCGRKPSVPSTCDGDLWELLRVPMESQVY